MNPLLKIFAALLVLVAAALGVMAFNIATRPAPAPTPVAPAPVAQAPTTPTQPVQTYPVVLAAKALSAGAILASDALEIQQWPVALATGFSDIQSVQGKALRFDLAAGEPLTQAAIQQGLATYLNEGERAITIPVNEISGAAAQLKAGDLVDVFFTLKHDQEVNDTQARLLLAKIRVLAYGVQTLDTPTPPEDKRDAKASPRTAILAIPAQRVNELLVAVESGKLLLALRSPLDDTQPDPTLFAPRTPLLAERPGLDAAQQAQLKLPANIAYAGESLSEVAGSRTDLATSQPPHSTQARAGGRSIQIIRAGRSEHVPY